MPDRADVLLSGVLRGYGVVLVLLLAGIACGSNGSSGSSPTLNSSPAASSAATVVFTKANGSDINLTVEIAETPEARARGLMSRKTLDADAGMLFVWPQDTGSGFWMKDTLIPLSVAFIDGSGKVVDIQDMQPLDETVHHSPAAYRYAVEANQGWFAAHGIESGDSATLPAGIE